MVHANNNEDNFSQKEISLKDVILKLREWRRYLTSKWPVLLVAVLIGGTLGLLYSNYKKLTYVAELSFALQNDNAGGLGTAAGLASQFGLDLGGASGGGAFSGDNLMELMRSRSMVENTLLTSVDISGKKQTLAELYITFNKLRDYWKNKVPELQNVEFLPDADRMKFTLQQDSILGSFYHSIDKNNLSVDKLDKKLNIIDVKVESANELFSKYFAEVLVKNVSDFYIQTKTKKSSQNVNILQHQTDSVRSQLNAAIAGVAFSSDNTPNPNPSLQVIKVPSIRRQIDVQANTSILTQLVINLEISKISLMKETPLIQIIDRPILPLEKRKIGRSIAIFLGAFLGLILSLTFLLVRKIFKDII